MKPTRFASLLALIAIVFSLIPALPAQTSKARPAPAAVPAKDPDAVDLEMISVIRREGLKNSKVMDWISGLTDGIGPRLTNSPNQKRANQWVKEQLEKMGLENVHFEAWGPFGRGWSYEVSHLRMVSPDTSELIALPKAWSSGTNGAVRGKVVHTIIKTKDDFEKYRGKLKGAIVLNGEMRALKPWTEAKSERYDEKSLQELTQYPMDGDRYAFYTPQLRAQLAAMARATGKFFEEEGALAVIDPSRTFDGGTIAVQGNGFAYKKDEPVGVPALVMSIEQFGRITRLVDAKKDVELELDVKTTFYDNNGDMFGYNVVGEIPGTDLKDEVVVLGGHLDSWHGATGATDDAAGVGAVMEAMRILKAVGAKPRRTVRVIAWTGEEQGLFGSRGYVAEHYAERPKDPNAKPDDKPLPWDLKPDWAKISVYFNLDNGTGKIRGVFLQDNLTVAPIFEKWMAPFKDLGMTTLVARGDPGSDHVSFDDAGIPAFQFVQDDIEYDTRTHHTNMDTLERVQKDDMIQASTIIAAFAYQAAMRDERMPRRPLPPQDVAPKPEPKPAEAKKK
ncbi:MAG: M20/M25/M40 family metallo-hydrolase [Acidobacteriales bacterium]|nr:M20/M25/M40 family metallo-hydrolase [Terriglobales bacterium]